MRKRLCEHCRVAYPEDDLTYRPDEDEYWCNGCLDNEAEAAWERQQADSPETMREAWIRTWNEKRRLR